MSNRDKLTDRLLDREGGLHTRKAPGGGEVMTGPTASRALKALGARAMTMDNTIFVDEGFDPGSPEDLALLAHERHHQAESGGTDQHSEFDLEELCVGASAEEKRPLRWFVGVQHNIRHRRLDSTSDGQ